MGIILLRDLNLVLDDANVGKNKDVFQVSFQFIPQYAKSYLIIGLILSRNMLELKVKCVCAC